MSCEPATLLPAKQLLAIMDEAPKLHLDCMSAGSKTVQNFKSVRFCLNRKETRIQFIFLLVTRKKAFLTCDPDKTSPQLTTDRLARVIIKQATPVFHCFSDFLFLTQSITNFVLCYRRTGPPTQRCPQATKQNTFANRRPRKNLLPTTTFAFQKHDSPCVGRRKGVMITRAAHAPVNSPTEPSPLTSPFCAHRLLQPQRSVCFPRSGMRANAASLQREDACRVHLLKAACTATCF